MDNFAIKNNKVLVGKTNSGKSQLLRYLLIKEKKHFSKIFLFSPTEEINKFYEGLIKKVNIFEQFTEKWLETLMKKLTEMSKKTDTKMRDVLLIFDDCCSDVDFQHSKALVKLFTRGRHLNIAVIITAQYPYHISPIQRCNCDYIMVGQLNKQSIQLITDEFLMGNISNKEFVEMYYRTTGNYQFLIINNNSVTTL
jgi:hypothetical protein